MIISSTFRNSAPRLALAALVAFVLTLGGQARAQSKPALVEAGRKLLESNCSRCHAIGRTGESTHPKAPPFRVIATRYPPESLAEALAEGIVTGHPDMPQFAFEPDEITAIIAYLDSLAPQRSN